MTARSWTLSLLFERRAHAGMKTEMLSEVVLDSKSGGCAEGLEAETRLNVFLCAVCYERA
jgi:hypothetical protein